MIRARIFAITAAALTVGTTACGPGGSNAQAPSSDIQSQAAPSLPTAAPETTATTGSAAAPVATQQNAGQDNGLCQAADLQLSFGKGGAAAGTAYRPLIFTNTSGRSCVIQGFPGVSYVGGDDGHQVGAPASRVDQKGPPITLAHGEQASAVIGFVTVENYDTEHCRPEPVKGLRIYPPQETASMYIPFEYGETGCTNAEVHQLSVRTTKPGRGEQ